MRHRNSVRKLGRTHAHRKAMFSNLVTSLFVHERIITTKHKGKELKRISERLITRAKKNLDLPSNDAGKILHNKRMVMRSIKDRDVVRKLFDDIAARFKNRNGGYTRMYLLGKKRAGDAAEMAIVELVERTVKASSSEESKTKEPEAKQDKAIKKAEKIAAKKKEKEEKKEKKKRKSVEKDAE